MRVRCLKVTLSDSSYIMSSRGYSVSFCGLSISVCLSVFVHDNSRTKKNRSRQHITVVADDKCEMVAVFTPKLIIMSVFQTVSETLSFLCTHLSNDFLVIGKMSYCYFKIHITSSLETGYRFEY